MASLQIAQYLGCVADLAELEARFAAGEIGTQDFATAIHGLWRSLTRPAVAEVFSACPWLRGIPEVCADVRERGERSAVITMSVIRVWLDRGWRGRTASSGQVLALIAGERCIRGAGGYYGC